MRFTAIIALEGEVYGGKTGDGRLLERGGLAWEEGPWPVKWRAEDDHSGFVIGVATEVWRDGATIRAAGELHDDSAFPDVVKAVDRVAELAEAGVAGVSVGMDDEQVELRVKKELLDQYEETDAPPPRGRAKAGRVVVAKWARDDALEVITHGRLREITITSEPAIVGTGVELARDPVAASLAMATAFSNPQFGPDGSADPRLVWQEPNRPEEVGHWGCPLTVTDDGRLFGHLATRGRCHGAFQACVSPPSSDGDFSRFLTGEAVRGIPTGPIILGTTHAVNPDGTVKSHDHLANTGQAVADVVVGQDAHGTWAAGRIRPGITPEQLAALKGSALSGEWYPYGHRLRLRAILAVNSPGYLVQRVRSARDGTLVAALTVGPLCCAGQDARDSRIEQLEAALAASLIRGVE